MNSSKKNILLVDFIRHGEPEGGDILRGRVDPTLTEQGWAQMQRATAFSADHEASTSTPAWTHVITSPLQRCRHFADQTAQKLGLESSVEEDWQEIDYGDWDGMPLSEWRELAAPQFKAFRKDLSALAPPNGEDYLSFRDRVLQAWERLAQLPDGSHSLVVTHGGVLRVVLPTVLGMPLNRSFPLHIPFACFSRVRLEVSEEKINASLLFHNAGEYERGGIV